MAQIFSQTGGFESETFRNKINSCWCDEAETSADSCWDLQPLWKAPSDLCRPSLRLRNYSRFLRSWISSAEELTRQLRATMEVNEEQPMGSQNAAVSYQQRTLTQTLWHLTDAGTSNVWEGFDWDVWLVSMETALFCFVLFYQSLHSPVWHPDGFQLKPVFSVSSCLYKKTSNCSVTLQGQIMCCSSTGSFI